jgi:hypothetical protein
MSNENKTSYPKRCSPIFFFLALLFSLSYCQAQTLTPQERLRLEARQKAHDERYAPTFYGIDIPETGARVLLIVDASKSMGRKDALRTDGGTRWQTLIDEVESMTQDMLTLQAKQPTLCFTVSILYEVGGSPHAGTPPFDLSQSTARDRLLNELKAKTLGQGGNFETTFCETLWPLVAKQHITHIFYLGDNDIGAYETTIDSAFNRWFKLSSKEPTEPELKPLWKLKCSWWEPWRRWRPPSKQKTIALKKETLRLPPPPKDVTFSAIVFGQASPLLKRFTETANGTYIERKKKKKRTKE